MAKYVDEVEIGTGGFGVVWRCRRDTDGAVFAKKLLSAGSTAAHRRFAREVRILRALDHPNIIKVVAVRLESAAPYFYVMPLYQRSLRQALPALKGDEARIRVIFSQILDAIEYAHAQGVLHRDLKPENVLLNNDAEVVISDFGLGRDYNARSTRQTGTGTSMGTVFYMAPEQHVDAKSADQRADIYSLGRMLYELYTGTLTAGAHDPALLPSHIRHLVSRCVQPAPERRFQSVTDLKRAWLAVSEAADEAASYERFDELVARLGAGARIQRNDALELLSDLLRLDDADLILQTVMKVQPRVFRVMAADDPASTHDLLERFTAAIASQSWPFEYTDRIADQIAGIFGEAADPEIRALLVASVCELGVSHNRFYVMRVAARLLAQVSPEGHASVASRILEMPKHSRVTLHSYMVDARVPPNVLRLFPTE